MTSSNPIRAGLQVGALVGRRGALIGAAAAGGIGAVHLPVRSALAQEPRRGGVMRTMIAGDPPLLILGLSTLAITQLVATKIYEGLVTFDPQLNPQPRLAKSWTISPDKKVFAFRLQENVRWHDGKPFTSEDVAFSIGSFQAAVNARSKIMIDNIASIETPEAMSSSLIRRCMTLVASASWMREFTPRSSVVSSQWTVPTGSPSPT